MPSDFDHIEALRQRLLRLKQQKTAEIAEIEEALHGISLAPKLLRNQPNPIETPHVVAAKHPTGPKANVNLASKIREYIDTHTGQIRVSDVMTYLKEHGIAGKYRSIYASAHMTLKRESEKGNLSFESGKGFWKGQEPDTQLVYSDEGGEVAIDRSVEKGES